MRFQPKTEEQIRAEQDARGPLPRGVYDAEIKLAVDKTSKAGNDMIEVDLIVYGPNGDEHQQRDWLLEAIAYKLRHCAQACGLLPDYERGELAAWQLEGKTLKVKLGIDTKGDRPRNKVDDYIVPDGAPQTAARKPEPALSDDIPF